MSAAILSCTSVQGFARPGTVGTAPRMRGVAAAPVLRSAAGVSSGRARPNHITRVAGSMNISLEDEDWDEDWDGDWEEDWEDAYSSWGANAVDSHYEQQVQARRNRSGNSYSFHGGKKGWGGKKKDVTASAKAYKGSKRNRGGISHRKLDGETDIFGLDQGDDWSESSNYAY